MSVFLAICSARARSESIGMAGSDNQEQSSPERKGEIETAARSNFVSEELNLSLLPHTILSEIVSFIDLDDFILYNLRGVCVSIQEACDMDSRWLPAIAPPSLATTVDCISAIESGTVPGNMILCKTGRNTYVRSSLLWMGSSAWLPGDTRRIRVLPILYPGYILWCMESCARRPLAANGTKQHRDPRERSRNKWTRTKKGASSFTKEFVMHINFVSFLRIPSNLGVGAKKSSNLGVRAKKAIVEC